MRRKLGPGWQWPTWRDTNQVQLMHGKAYLEVPEGDSSHWRPENFSIVQSVDICFVERQHDGKVRVPGFHHNDCAMWCHEQFRHIPALTIAHEGEGCRKLL